ncbi:MAG: hypothetical protein H0U90_03740 [Actinobacteria bacterium]|nr:hypothetical protein [Actinomycetota bacterium]
MPSRKQRRRREKLGRHEYEYVVETEEGEVPVERLRDLERSDGDGRPGRRAGAEPQLVDRRGRPIQKPSLRKVLRRGLIFGPLLFLFVYLAYGDDLTIEQAVLQALLLIVFFIPFSYLVDAMVYRMMVRRAERERAAKRGR